MKLRNKLSKFLLLLSVGVTFSTMSVQAETYLEKKDNQALDSIERIIKKASAAVNNKIFDGKKIVPGTKAADVRLYNDMMQGYFHNAANTWNHVSKSGLASARAKKVLPQLQKFQSYASSLYKAVNAYSKQLANRQKQAKANKATRLQDQKTCINFRNQIDPSDRQRLQTLVKLKNGSDKHYFQDVKEINKQRDTFKRVAAVCNRPEFKNIEQICLSLDPVTRPVEADYCSVPANEQAILQLAARNYATKFMGMMGVNKKFNIAAFKKDKGWVKLEGPVNWASLGKNEKTTKLLLKRVKPVFEAVGLNGAETLDGIQKQNSKNAQLIEAVKQLAPEWKMPGDACAGKPCKIAETTLEKWYPKGEVISIKQKQQNWIVVTDEIRKIPEYRYRSGWALLKVAGDPYCQLRSWTVNEQYSGGGSYQTPDRANIGYVRWQACN
jgi:hypothetical protein